MTDLKKEFPVLDKYTYLNTASCGLISKSLVAWRKVHDQNLLEGGSVFRDLHRPHLERIRGTVARFFNTSENETALVPNFSFGFNTLLSGLPKKQRILLLQSDFPSINWAVEQHGFEVFYVAVDENLEQNIEEAIRAHQPNIFAFSLVQYLSGIKIDLDFIKRLKAYHPDLLLVADGTQFLGTTQFNFSESGLDVLGASTYKWILAGYGNGVFMIRAEAQEKISPETIGFNSADAIYGNRERISFVKRFEPGHQDTLNYGSLEQAIQFLNNIGMEVVEEKIRILSTIAKVRFSELGLLAESVVKRKNHSNIFNLKGDAGLFQKLKEHNIICSQRANGIRVSFHFYNSEEDLEKLISVIKKN